MSLNLYEGGEALSERGVESWIYCAKNLENWACGVVPAKSPPGRRNLRGIHFLDDSEDSREQHEERQKLVAVWGE